MIRCEKEWVYSMHVPIAALSAKIETLESRLVPGHAVTIRLLRAEAV